jgi:hypothetical protein
MGDAPADMRMRAVLMHDQRLTMHSYRTSGRQQGETGAPHNFS